MRPPLQMVLDSIAQMPTAELPAFLGELETIRMTAIARMSTPAPEKTNGRAPEQLLDVAEAAKRLTTSEDFLYRHWRTLPFAHKYPSGLRFTSSGIDD